ncbi:MAG: metallophosphoesterase [Burkholderiales bacterium PBB4]|nr:MAG: metallophosphoesterase [Burkholderiales bacterium PBB4]
MKIQLLSDLHLEVHPHWVPTPAPGADVLVLAGDIGSYQAGSLLQDTDFGLARFSPQLGWPTPVVFVPGNHEYDTQDFDAAYARLRDTAERLGLIWLERETVVLSGVRFVGTTLWTDFDALAPQPGLHTGPGPATANALAQQLKARDKAFRAANYYLRKTGVTRGGEAWLAPGMRDQALVCQDWLRGELARPFDGPTVAVTHFAPSLRSSDPRYGLTPGTAGFCNALDVLLPQAQLWLHGHLHAPSDYVHQGCRVVANPLGYARKNEQVAFKPQMLIEIGHSAHG